MLSKKVSVKNEIITNKDLPHEAFGLYVVLKSMAYDDTLKIQFDTLKEKTRMNNQRRLKKYLDVLADFNLIQRIDRIRQHNLLEINFIKQKEVYYTLLDKNVIEKIINITDNVDLGRGRIQDTWYIALRLYYYYEKNYNSEMGCACPSFDQIYQEAGIHKSYISALNDVFQEGGILRIYSGEWYKKQNEHGHLESRKKRNEYVPLWDRGLLKSKIK